MRSLFEKDIVIGEKSCYQELGTSPHGGLPVKKDGKWSYDIFLNESFENLPECLNTLQVLSRRICIVTDSNVDKLYAEELKQLLEPYCKTVTVFVFPAGEDYKTLKTVQDLYEVLIQEQFDRKDLLIALGGGVVGDLTGYAAATYLRGIDFVQIPTTLLSQVDSSIGGKTGVDFDCYKNMVGAFYQPRLVYMNISVLKSLLDKQYYSGMGEIIKHALIKNAAYLDWLVANTERVKNRDLEVLLQMIANSCLIKREVVQNDPMEKGERALLNFGHTFGHAVEKLKKFEMLHGECVAVGSVAASYLSYLRGSLTEEEYRRTRSVFEDFCLPVKVDGIQADEIIQATKMDKKMERGKIKFIVLKQLGNAVIDNTITEEEMAQALASVLNR